LDERSWEAPGAEVGPLGRHREGYVRNLELGGGDFTVTLGQVVHVQRVTLDNWSRDEAELALATQNTSSG
jgi:hypothetical protein